MRPGPMIIVLVVTLAASLHAPASSAATSEAQRLLNLINEARARAGAPRVYADGILMLTAQRHAEKMAAAGRIFHNPSYPSGIGAWTAWGENVGAGPDVESVHRGFMASGSHSRNILGGQFNAVGVGIARYSGGIMVVEDFLGRPGGSSPRPRPNRTPPPPPAPPEPPPPEPPKPPEEIGKWIPVGSLGQMASFDQLDQELANLTELHRQLTAIDNAILRCRFDAIAPGPSPGTVLVLTVCHIDSSANPVRDLF